MEQQKSPSIIAIGAVVAILLGLVMAFMGNPKVSGGINYLSTGNTAPSGDLHALARQDAIDNGISADLFERQINQESGFNPNAVSPMGAIGIAQIMPSTAQGWHVDPHDPIASLSAAAKAMTWYNNHYGNYAKALAAYNAGTSTVDTAIAEYGASWRIGLPAETQRYITAIIGV
jgi:soluble lytic murein transglycosylase-like protein